MRLQQYITESSSFFKVIKNVSGMDFKKLKTFLQGQFDTFVDALSGTEMEPQIVSIINKNFDTKYKSLEQMKKVRLKESFGVNEDAAHWWASIKQEAFPTLAFYPALTAWLEIDKLLRGGEFNGKVFTIYSLFWLFLVSSKYVKEWMKWKKDNPDEYKAERAQGKGGVI